MPRTNAPERRVAHVPRRPERQFGEDRGDSRRFARAAIDAGADLVLGSGPHVLRVRLAPDGRLVRGRVTPLRLDELGVPRRDPEGGGARLMRRRSAQDFGAASPWRRGEMAPDPS